MSKKESEEKIDWLDKVDNGTRIIDEVEFCLRDTARAFSRTGNEKMAEELFDHCKWLRKASELVQNGVSDATSEMLRSSQLASQTTFVAALAGACVTDEAREMIRPLAESVAKRHEKDT